jgi:hypothetical protein
LIDITVAQFPDLSRHCPVAVARPTLRSPGWKC